ncbi:pantoate--beta-alanine ligase [Romboutsia weinsteinii]|uniref:Pantothenate synthetase n=1 Tax=Romboutsia weinsteinii TaxID=2020949 RepID=A0A371J9B1_9FIRM|nr:pantoate--beta-alanine ligase [Romboutsia weinsteinii]RDY29339.1 pantoate--beta-alanine ligase [Romboutsia weinsteinii]
MIILNTIEEIREQVKKFKNEGLSVGLVPTMGYLHEGHESLIKRASKENDKVVVSIFINPTQFGENEDLDSYPRDLERDTIICENAGADIIFNPNKEEIYNNDFSTFVEMNNLSNELCGKSRPTHFGGVCTVVSKLFNIVKPDKAYFGQKDAQQLAIIKRMVIDLNFDVEVIGCPIIREKDGLAKSSRNSYLSEEERKIATILNKALNHAKKIIFDGEKNSNIIVEAIKEVINKEPRATIDYIEVVDSVSIKPIEYIEMSVLVAIAVYIGKARLIDNFTYEV